MDEPFVYPVDKAEGLGKKSRSNHDARPCTNAVLVMIRSIGTVNSCRSSAVHEWKSNVLGGQGVDSRECGGNMPTIG